MQAPEVPPGAPAAAPVLPLDEEPLLPVEDEPPLPVLPVLALPALPVDGFAPPFPGELPDDEPQARVPHTTNSRKAELSTSGRIDITISLRNTRRSNYARQTRASTDLSLPLNAGPAVWLQARLSSAALV